MKLLLVGCGGYAAGYVRELLSPLNVDGHIIEGIVDPYAEQSPVIGLIREKGIPVYDTLEAFYRRHSAPLAVIVTPIGLHVHDALVCLAHGSHVLMEKPLAATSGLCREITGAARDAGKRLGVGYQLCYDPIMLRLKEQIEAGAFGRALGMKALILWQRTHAYYARSGGWAGHIRLPDGTPVYDSILTNATSHYLMNMLWLTTPGFYTQPALSVEAQLGRVYPIETFDTAAARFRLPCGCEGLLYASHVAGTAQETPPAMEYRFEKAVIRVRTQPERGAVLSLTDESGAQRELGVLCQNVIHKTSQFIRAIENDLPLSCPGEAGLATVLTYERLFENGLPDVESIQPVIREEQLLWSPQVADALRAGFEAGRLPRELGLAYGQGCAGGNRQ